MLDVSSVVACSYASKVHSQDDLAEPCANSAEHMALAVVVELRNESSGCQVVEGPWVVHKNPKNGCRRSHCCHNKTVDEAFLEDMVPSRILLQNSRCFPWENLEDVLEQEDAPDLASRRAVGVLVPASANLI